MTKVNILPSGHKIYSHCDNYSMRDVLPGKAERSFSYNGEDLGSNPVSKVCFFPLLALLPQFCDTGFLINEVIIYI